MQKVKEIFKNNKALIITFFTIFVLLLIINSLTIWAADDYAFYNNVWLGESKFSFLRIYERTTAFYFAWTGRYLSTFINYIFLYFPKPIFNVVNSLIYTGLIYLIYKMVKKDDKKTTDKENALLVTTIFGLTWVLVPSVGQVMFWQIGAVIYLWMYFLLALLVTYYIRLLRKQKTLKDNIINIILITILGLAAGNGFETNSLVLLMFIFLSIFYIRFIKKEKLPKVAIFGFIASLIGFFTNFFSPGNSVRMGSMGTEGGLITKLFYGLGPWFYNGILRSKMFITITLLLVIYIMYIISKKKKIDTKLSILIASATLFIGGFIMTIANLLPPNVPEFLDWFYTHPRNWLFIVVMLFMLLLVMVIVFIKNRKDILKETNHTTNTITLFLTVAALFGTAAYIMTPLAWPRSYMAMALTLIIAMVYVGLRIDFSKKYLILKKVFFSIIMFVVAVTYIYTVYDCYKAVKWNNETKETIEKAIADGEETIYVDTFISKSHYNGASIEKWVIPIEENGEIDSSYEWINQAVTKYYFKDKEAWNEGKRIIGK